MTDNEQKDGYSTDKAIAFAGAVALLLLLIAFAWISQPFWEPGVFALGICFASWPLRNAARRFGGRRLSSLAMAAAMSFGVGVPACMAWNYSFRELDVMLEKAQQQPRVSVGLGQIKSQGLLILKKAQSSRAWSERVESSQNLPWGALGLVSILTYFMLADAELAMGWMQARVGCLGGRWSSAYMRASIAFGQTAKSCMWFGGGSALCLWALFAWAGAPSPLAFAVAAAVSSMLPFVAPVMVSAVGVALIAQDNVAGPLALIVAGGGGLGIINNILRPKWIGERSGLRLPFALLGMAGGAIAWGPPGLLLGPSIVAALLELANQPEFNIIAKSITGSEP